MTRPAAGIPVDVERGQRVYTPLVLRAYDLFVLGFSNRFAWRCRSATMLERYDRYVGRRHLDLGDKRGLRRGLASKLEDVEIEVVGVVALFAASSEGVRHPTARARTPPRGAPAAGRGTP